MVVVVKEFVKMEKNILDGLDIIKKNFLLNPYYSEDEYRRMLRKIEQIILEEENKEFFKKEWIV